MPTVDSPVQGSPAIVVVANADTLTLDFWMDVLSGPGSGDCLLATIEVYAETATDAVPGALLATVSSVPTTLESSTHRRMSITSSTLIRTARRYRLRYLSTEGGSFGSLAIWSAWTPLADGHVKVVYPVGAPLAPYMDRGPTAPTIAGSLNSTYPASYLSGVEIEVYRDTASGPVTMWAPGMLTIGGTSTRSETSYAGTALSPGMVLRWRMRHQDRDDTVGDWTTWQSVTVVAESGPDAMSPLSPSTKLLTRTPTFTIAHSETFDEYQWRLYRDGSVIHDSEAIATVATTSVAVTVPADLLSWGDGAANLLEWDAGIVRVGSGGDLTFSPKRGIRVNSLPTTTLTQTEWLAGYVNVVDPEYVKPYTDTDAITYGETPVALEWEIRQGATPRGTGSLVKHVTDLTPSTAPEQLGATFVPTIDLAYDVRARYRDDATATVSTTMAANSLAGATNVKVTAITSLVAGDWLTLEPGTADEETRQVTVVGTAGSGGTGITVAHGYTLAHTSADTATVYPWGAWSAWLTFTYVAPPVVAAVLPADAASVVDPTRTLTWTYSSAGSHVQDHAVISLYTVVAGVDSLVYQATQDGAAVAYDIPTLLLTTGLTYAWVVEAFDDLGFSGSTTRRTFTTLFTAPSALTDLVATVIPGRSKVALAWTASTDAYLDHYRVWWQQQDGTWVRVDGGPETLDDGNTKVTTAAFAHYGARLGANSYRVEAHNGAQASTAATVSGTLFGPRSGSWALAQWRDDADTEMATTMASDSAIAAVTIKLTSVTDISVGDRLTLEPQTVDEEVSRVVAVGTAGAGGTGVTVYPAYALAHSSGNVATVHEAGATVLAFDPESVPRIVNMAAETFRPPGRGAAVHLSWGSSGRSVSLACGYAPSEDGDISGSLATLHAADARAWLKAPSGYSIDPLRVVITSISDEPRPGGRMGLSVGFDEVEED